MENITGIMEKNALIFPRYFDYSKPFFMTVLSQCIKRDATTIVESFP